jgi:hypothetical protein
MHRASIAKAARVRTRSCLRALLSRADKLGARDFIYL